jgi:hypothetical protein
VDEAHVRYRLTVTLGSLEDRSALLGAALGALYAAGMDGGGQASAARRE